MATYLVFFHFKINRCVINWLRTLLLGRREEKSPSFYFNEVLKMSSLFSEVPRKVWVCSFTYFHLEVNDSWSNFIRTENTSTTFPNSTCCIVFVGWELIFMNGDSQNICPHPNSQYLQMRGDYPGLSRWTLNQSTSVLKIRWSDSRKRKLWRQRLESCGP